MYNVVKDVFFGFLLEQVKGTSHIERKGRIICKAKRIRHRCQFSLHSLMMDSSYFFWSFRNFFFGFSFLVIKSRNPSPILTKLLDVQVENINYGDVMALQTGSQALVCTCVTDD